MSTVSKRPNVKLAKLFYKYAEDMKKQAETQEAEAVEETENKPEETKDYESFRPINFSWFIENKIAAMGWPRSVENLNYICDAGVDHLITLSPEKLPPILECERKLRWSEIRINEFSAPTLKQILKFIAMCERAEIRGEVLGVHCRQGRGRTGTMLACYLVYFKHMTPERAILTVRLQRPGSCETYEQEKIVSHYHDCLRGTITIPDYNMVDNKLYFDFSMKYMFDDDEKKENEDGGPDGGDVLEKKPETLQLRKKKKSKAMVINHKIYF
ncbi:dual specificity protein phosphatase 23-like [Epargyreus clarus]|uniref:dual specificity protein phosphatase 23-like n=1 Tax=Epargyreus clarus TaxID=520877 RepID=UPI003C2FF0CA